MRFDGYPLVNWECRHNQPLIFFFSLKQPFKRTHYIYEMNQDIEARQCQDILRKNNLYPIKKLGKGAFGTVYLVSRSNIKGHEAQLFSVKCTNKKNFIKKPMLKKYLKQQIDIQGGINHPNIVKLLRSFEDEGWNFMLMQYCDCGNIYNFQSQKPKKVFEFNEAKKYMIDVLDGLKNLRSNNILHRDLKPQNILLIKDNKTKQIRAKICDFGFAKETEQQASTFCGTTYFMAPQIFQKKKYDINIDIWSAGVIFFYMIFGVYPFKSMNMAAEIEAKCKNGFNLQHMKGLENESLTEENKKLLTRLFQKIFKLAPQDRIPIQQFKKLLQESRPSQGHQMIQQSEENNQTHEQIIEFLSQRIVFCQKVFQQIKSIAFLSPSEELALKYYLDKYCVTLILMHNKLCFSNPTLSKLKKQLLYNQQRDAASLMPIIDKIQIPRFAQVFSTVCTDDFSSYKEAYRIILSYVFSKASKSIQDMTLRTQMKLKIFCCHSINRVFQQQYRKQVFIHYFLWQQRKTMRAQKDKFNLQQINKWIEQDNPQRINQTVKIMCDKFYKKNK